jgi:hypothetical protein
MRICNLFHDFKLTLRWPIIAQVSSESEVLMTSLGEACAAGDIQSMTHLLDNGASVNDFIVSGYATAFRLAEGWRDHDGASRCPCPCGGCQCASQLQYNRLSGFIWKCLYSCLQLEFGSNGMCASLAPPAICSSCGAFVCVQPIEGSDDDDGPTPLSVATMHGQLEAVRLLLDRGASVDKGRVSLFWKSTVITLCVGGRGLCCW